MKNRIVKATLIAITAGMCLTGCSNVSNLLSSNASTGRTTLIPDESEEDKEPVEEIEAAAEFDKWYSDDQPGIPQNVNVDDYVGDVDTSNLTVPESALTMTDDSLQLQKNNLLDTYATESDDSSLTAEDGTRVTISYEGVVDGQTPSGYTAEAVSFKIGSNTMPEEFEEKLIGMHPGDTRNITVDYAEDYNDISVAGKTVIFSVSMDSIAVQAEFNDDFVKEHTDYKSVKEYEKALQKQYRSTALYQTAYSMIGELAGKMEGYPEDYLEAYKSLLRGFDELTYENAMTLNNTEEPVSTFEEYMQQIYGDDYEGTLEEYAKTYVGQQLATIKVGQALGLEFTADDYNEYIENNGVSDENIQRYGKGYISIAAYQQFVLSKLMDSFTISKS